MTVRLAVRRNEAGAIIETCDRDVAETGGFLEAVAFAVSTVQANGDIRAIDLLAKLAEEGKRRTIMDENRLQFRAKA